MNVISFFITRALKSRNFGKAAILLPLLGKMKLSEVSAGALRIVKYMVSGHATKKDFLYTVAALLYFLSPIDILPEFLPLLGIADDAVIATMLLGYLNSRARERDLLNQAR